LRRRVRDCRWAVVTAEIAGPFCILGLVTQPYFHRHAPEIRLVLGSIASGLRKAQLGAAWALGSHWTISHAPAQIVLPTGTGKMLVMTLAPFLRRSRRVLVVAPGRVARDQLEQAFTTFADLKRTDVVPASCKARTPRLDARSRPGPMSAGRCG
jgi:superfamily II DNA or RNA helicase